MKKKIFDNWPNYYLYYILMLVFFGVFSLYYKHDVGNDSTISDWLINYSGGFVRRGLIGQLTIELSFELRKTILIFQIFFFTTYYLLVFFLLRKTLKNRLIILSIFTPIFILYPVAEIEALGRKEILIFLIIAIYFLIDVRKFKNQLLFKLIIFPILILIWEPAIFFFPYLLLIDLVSFRINKFNINLIYIFLSYSIVFLTTILFT